MKKLFLIWISPTIVSTILCGQDKVIELKVDSSTIRISEFPFDEVVVLDSRVDTSKIGMVQIGAFNRLVATRFDEPAKSAIQKYIQGLISDSKKQSHQLLVNIKRLQIFEKSSAVSEKGFCEFTADAYMRKNDSMYVKVFSADTLYIIKGFDVTKSLINTIHGAIDNMVYQIAGTDISKTDSGSVVSLAEVISGIQNSWARYPINSSRHNVKGVYKSFDDFRNNVIDSLNYTVMNITDTTYQVYTVNKDGSRAKKVVKGIWGINDGHLPSIVIEKNFIPLETRNGTFYCTASIKDTQAKATAAAVGGASFGILGALIASSLVGDRKSEFYLDMDTGRMIEYSKVH